MNRHCRSSSRRPDFGKGSKGWDSAFGRHGMGLIVKIYIWQGITINFKVVRVLRPSMMY